MSDCRTLSHQITSFFPTLINSTSTVGSPLAQKLYLRLCLSYMLPVSPSAANNPGLTHMLTAKHTAGKSSAIAPLSTVCPDCKSVTAAMMETAEGGVRRKKVQLELCAVTGSWFTWGETRKLHKRRKQLVYPISDMRRGNPNQIHLNKQWKNS